MNKFLAGNRKLFFGVFVALIAYVLCQTGQLSGELFTDISKFDLGAIVLGNAAEHGLRKFKLQATPER